MWEGQRSNIKAKPNDIRSTEFEYSEPGMTTEVEYFSTALCTSSAGEKLNLSNTKNVITMAPAIRRTALII